MLCKSTRQEEDSVYHRLYTLFTLITRLTDSLGLYRWPLQRTREHTCHAIANSRIPGSFMAWPTNPSPPEETIVSTRSIIIFQTIALISSHYPQGWLCCTVTSVAPMLSRMKNNGFSLSTCPFFCLHHQFNHHRVGCSLSGVKWFKGFPLFPVPSFLW